MRTRRLVTALVLAAGAVLLGVLAPAASANVETATSGQVQAQLSYTKNGDFDYTGVRIKFTRGGSVVTDEPVPGPCPDCQPMPAGQGDRSSLTLRDLNGNGEPEAIVDLFTGGAHCCFVSVIYRYDPASNTYKHIVHDWADAGYVIGDFDGDGSSTSARPTPASRPGSPRTCSRASRSRSGVTRPAA